jgi:hypothetical protein
LTGLGTGQTVKMIDNNGTGLVSPIPGYAETVSAVGREYVLSTEDGDKTAITFHEIDRSLSSSKKSVLYGVSIQTINLWSRRYSRCNDWFL